jgi:hypothetical protein
MKWFINKKITLGFTSALGLLAAIGLVAVLNLAHAGKLVGNETLQAEIAERRRAEEALVTNQAYAAPLGVTLGVVQAVPGVKVYADAELIPIRRQPLDMAPPVCSNSSAFRRDAGVAAKAAPTR